MNWLARWAFRLLVAPRIQHYYWTGEESDLGIRIPPKWVKVVFRGR